MAERETERVIVTDGGGRSGGGGSTAVVALVIVALLVILFLVFGRGLLSSSNVPDKIDANVDINTPASGGGSGSGN